MTQAIFLGLLLPTAAMAGVYTTVALRSYDRLVRMWYTQNRSSWESFGRPAGFFWQPRGVKASTIRRNAVYFSILFNPEKYMQKIDGVPDAPELARKIRKACILSALFAVLMMCVFPAMLVISWVV